MTELRSAEAIRNFGEYRTERLLGVSSQTCPTASARSGSFDKMRLDTLLYSLGGFAKPPRDLQFGRSFPPEVIQQLAVLAKKPRAAKGEVAGLAERYGRSANSMTAVVSRLRRRGQIAAYWRQFLT